MINEDELKGWDLERINREIKQREYLLDQMVGTLYPSILCYELNQLQEVLNERHSRGSVAST